MGDNNLRERLKAEAIVSLLYGLLCSLLYGLQITTDKKGGTESASAQVDSGAVAVSLTGRVSTEKIDAGRDQGASVRS